MRRVKQLVMEQIGAFLVKMGASQQEPVASQIIQLFN